MTNKYFVVPNGSRSPIRWNPENRADRPTYDCLYFGGVFSAFEERMRGRGFTVYLTADVERLPSYGRDVIAVSISDERARYPKYASRVAVTFKCYGTDLIQGCGVLQNPSLLGLTTTLQFFRMNVLRIPSVYRHKVFSALGGASGDRIFPIPLGYFRQADLPLQPILERRFDAYFRGSMAQRVAGTPLLGSLLQAPKTRSRAEMISEMQRIATLHPEFNIAVEQLPAFFNGSEAEAVAFSEAMMQTKICIVPRGASYETFRFFEALRYGCVVVAEPLPKRWFYEGSPAITVQRWSELESILVPLLRDPVRMQELHAQALHWWQSVCGEDAVGAYMAAAI